MRPPVVTEHAVGEPPASALPPIAGLTVRKQVAGASPRPVPDRLAVVLRRAQTAEQGATGGQRIPALRLTRYLIAGVRYAGYTNAGVAECLGISPDAVRARGSSDGW